MTAISVRSIADSRLGKATGLGAVTGAFMTASMYPAMSEEQKGFLDLIFGNKETAPISETVSGNPGAMPKSRKPIIRQKAAAYFAAHECTLGSSVYFRAAKTEQRVEMWAQCGSAAYKKIATWSFTANRNSQLLGYKNYQGDARIPEGMRRVRNVNDVSSYYLSFNMGYPDAADLARPRPKGKGVGGDTMMHGPFGSIGCIPIAFENIEIAYASAEAAIRNGRAVYFDIFPSFDMSDSNLQRMASLSPENKKYLPFWRNMAQVDSVFQQTHMRGNVVPYGTMYALGGMHPSEPQVAAVVEPAEKEIKPRLKVELVPPMPPVREKFTARSVPVTRAAAVPAPLPPVPETNTGNGSLIAPAMAAPVMPVSVTPLPAPERAPEPGSLAALMKPLAMSVVKDTPPVAAPSPGTRLGPPDMKSEIVIPVEIVVECKDGQAVPPGGFCAPRPMMGPH